MIKLGDKIKDAITGFSGIAVCRTEWLNGCVRVGIQPEKLQKDGTILGFTEFDESQIILIKQAAYERPIVKEMTTKPTGGPRPSPTHHRSPKPF